MKIKINKKLLEEGSSTTALGASPIDDGPNFFYSNFETYKKASDEMASKLGMKVLDYISKKDDITRYGHKKMGNNGAEIKPIDKKDMKHMAKIVGFEVVDKYLKKLIREELQKYLKENDIEYTEHIFIEE